jgi:tRNA nucleotidyltransferase/poly(A) polymerase
MKKIEIPQEVRDLSNLFHTNGKKLYVVGGYVRDKLMGLNPLDIDLSTDSLPDETISFLQDLYKLDYVGKAFGVIIVHVGEMKIEIASFRSDGIDETGGRHPEIKLGVSIEDDVLRRDITISAIFYDIQEEKVVDLVGGLEHINDKVISTVGDPKLRLIEDQLRSLRILRFACRYDFKIDDKTHNALKEFVDLSKISNERIWDEFKKAYEQSIDFSDFLNSINTYYMWNKIFPGSVIYNKITKCEEFVTYIANLFRDEDVYSLEKKLVSNYKIEYEVSSKVVFLLKLMNLSPDNVFELYKLKVKCHCSDAIILDWLKLNNLENDKLFLNFISYIPNALLSKELMDKGFSGKELGAEIKRIESTNFNASLDNNIILSNFNYEENVIDPILKLIKDNQEFLCEKENLPQLAKLGYIYSTLYYPGRYCWGYDGILRDKSKDDTIISCESNPRDKIEMYGGENSLIYDSWAMHTTLYGENLTHSDFLKIIKEPKELTEVEIMLLKSNKTLDEWVEILTHKDYRYVDIYQNRKRVLDCLFIYGDYKWNNDGYLEGRPENDMSLYGDWRNAKFREDIEHVVYSILDIPEVKTTLDLNNDYIQAEKKKREDADPFRKLFKFSEENKDVLLDFGKALEEKKSGTIKEEKLPYNKYYPIGSNCIISSLLNSGEKKYFKKVESYHQSYIDGAIEICKEILQHEDVEVKGNIEFARKFLYKMGHVEYGVLIPNEIDKYKLKDNIENVMCYLTDTFKIVNDIYTSVESAGHKCYKYEFSDSNISPYGSNTFYYNFSLIGYNIPKGYSSDVNILTGTDFYDNLVKALKRLSHIKDIKKVYFYINNDAYVSNFKIEIIIYDEFNWIEKKQEMEDRLISSGFQVGSKSVSLSLKDIILVCRRPEGMSNSLKIAIKDKNWNLISGFDLDERGFNTLRMDIPKDSSSYLINMKKWIEEEFVKMKSSDPEYGTYELDKKQGKKYLYVEDFMIWLKNSEVNKND